MSETCTLKLSQIKENPSALRAVVSDSIEYKGLVQSIASKGVLNSITVRPIYNGDGSQETNDSGDEMFYLVDGLQRYTASKEAGLDTIPCLVKPMSDEEALKVQIVTNVQRIETKPVEYAKALGRLLAMNPALTASQLAADLGKTSAWIGEQLGLQNLVDSAAKLVDEGRIKLTAAYALAKLPPEAQDDFIERAQNQNPEEFVQAVNTRRKELQKAKREGRQAGAETFTPTPHLQKMADIRTESEVANIGQVLIAGIPGLSEMGADAAALAGYRMALQWVTHLDPNSVAVARQKFEDNQRKQLEKKQSAAADRNKLRAKEAELKAERFKLESETITNGGDLTAVLKDWDEKNHFVKGRYCPPQPEVESKEPVATASE